MASKRKGLVTLIRNPDWVDAHFEEIMVGGPCFVDLKYIGKLGYRFGPELAKVPHFSGLVLATKREDGMIYLLILTKNATIPLCVVCSGRKKTFVLSSKKTAQKNWEGFIITH